MLVLPIKKKWFDLICSGEKKEEYRDIKPYYDSRLPQKFGYFLRETTLKPAKVFDFTTQKSKEAPHDTEVIFRNGYRETSPYVRCLCGLRIGAGKEEWGAEKGKEYYILEIKKLMDRSGADE